MNRLEWIKNEISIACNKKEWEGNSVVSRVDFNLAKAAFLIVEDVLSVLLKNEYSDDYYEIIRKTVTDLINEKPLTPIKDIPEVWEDVKDNNDESICRIYRCIRKKTLYKFVYPDGSIRFTDKKRVVFKNQNKEEYFDFVTDLIDDLYPIKMPYDASKTILVNGNKFLLYKNSPLNYDTLSIKNCIVDGDVKEINKFYVRTSSGNTEISEQTYQSRFNKYELEKRNEETRELKKHLQELESKIHHKNDETKKKNDIEDFEYLNARSMYDEV